MQGVTSVGRQEGGVCSLNVRVQPSEGWGESLVVNGGLCQLQKSPCRTALSTRTHEAVTDVVSFRGHEWLTSWERNLMQNDCGLDLGLSQQREFRSLVAFTRLGCSLPWDRRGRGVLAGSQTQLPVSSLSHFAPKGRLSDVLETL